MTMLAVRPINPPDLAGGSRCRRQSLIGRLLLSISLAAASRVSRMMLLDMAGADEGQRSRMCWRKVVLPRLKRGEKVE